MVLDSAVFKRVCKAAQANERVDDITQIDVKVLVIKWVEEIVYLPEELLRANEDAPSASVKTSLVPEHFAVVFTHATLILELILVLVNFNLQFVIFDADVVPDGLMVVLLRRPAGVTSGVCLTSGG